MVIDAIVNFFAGLIASLIAAMPTLERPPWFDTALQYWSSSFEVATGLAHWFPFPVISIVAQFVLGAVLTAISIKVIRIVASFLTAGGGSAA